MTRQAQGPEGADKPAGDPARKKRRSLAEGPAVRRALASAEADAKDSGGWKLLDLPPESLEAREGSGLLKTIDDTQPEPSWTVVGVATESLRPGAVAEATEAPAAKAPPATNATRLASGNARPAPSPVAAKTGKANPALAQTVSQTSVVPRPSASRVPAVAQPPRPASNAPARSATPALGIRVGGTPLTAKPQAPMVSPSRAASAAELPSSPAATRATPLPVPPRALMHTQIGIAPPPVSPSATVEPTRAPVAPPEPARTARPSDDAFAATQLAAPRPPELEAALALAPPVPARPPARASQPSFSGISPADLLPWHGAPASTAKPPPTARSPEWLALADTQQGPSPIAKTADVSLPAPVAAQVHAAPPSQALSAPEPRPAALALARTQLTSGPEAGAYRHAEPASPPSTATRGALPSDVFATTQDAPVSRTVAGIRRSLIPLPASLRNASQPKLLALAALALCASLAPLALVAFAASSLVAGDAKETAAAPPAALAEAHKARARAQVSAPPAAPPARAAAPAVAPAPPAAAPAAAPAAPTARAPERAVQTAGAADPSAAAAAAPRAIPWQDRASVHTGDCQSLAQPGSGPPGFRLQQAIKNGQQELIRGNVKGAHVAFCEAVLLGAPTPTVLIGLSQVLLMQSDLDGALAAVDQLLAQKPTSKPALELRGDVLIRMGRVEEAERAWLAAVGAERATPALTENLLRASSEGVSLALKAGDLARADRMLRRSIAMRPNDVDACVQLAQVLLKSEERAAAKRWLDYAKSLEPQHPKLANLESALL